MKETLYVYSTMIREQMPNKSSIFFPFQQKYWSSLVSKTAFLDVESSSLHYYVGSYGHLLCETFVAGQLVFLPAHVIVLGQ